MLLRLIAAVFDSIGLRDEVRPVTVTRVMRLKVLHTLRPAESALRRMIFALAVEMESKGYVPPKWVKRAGPNQEIESGGGEKRAMVPAFRLIDPRKWFWWIGTKSQSICRGLRGLGMTRMIVPSQPLSDPNRRTMIRWTPRNCVIVCWRSKARSMTCRGKPNGCCGSRRERKFSRPINRPCDRGCRPDGEREAAMRSTRSCESATSSRFGPSKRPIPANGFVLCTLTKRYCRFARRLLGVRYDMKSTT